MVGRASAVVAGLLLAAPAWATTWTVTPSSSLTLAQAFAGNNGQIKAGDTVVVQAGRYPGHFIETVNGVTFKGVGLPQIDGNWPWVGDIPQAMLVILGNDVTVQGFEITDTGTDTRVWLTSSDDDPANANVRRRNGVFTYGARLRLIDNVIHDGANGLGAWDQCVDCQFSGNVIYNNGFQAPDRGHGHGIYTQNTTGHKTFSLTATFNNFGYGIQQYGSSSAHQDHYIWQNLLIWNQTALFGGNTPLVDLTVSDSHFYRANLSLGYGNPDNSGVTIQGSTFWGTTFNLSLSKAVTVARNLFTAVGQQYLAAVFLNGTGNVPADYTWTANQYYQPQTDIGNMAYVRTNRPLDCFYYWFATTTPGYGYCPAPQAWQQTLGWDPTGTWHPEPKPSGVNLTVLADPYDVTRHTVVIENWDSAPVVTVDVSGWGWMTGQAYRWRNLSDYFVDTQTPTYDGSGRISLSMLNHTVAKPYGYPTALGPDTFPQFGAFLLETIGNAQPPKPPCKPHWWKPCHA